MWHNKLAGASDRLMTRMVLNVDVCMVSQLGDDDEVLMNRLQV